MAVLTRKTFVEEHEEVERRLRRYALTKRGRRSIDDTIIKELGRRGAQELYSNNARARIGFMEAALDQFRVRYGRVPGKGFFFLTISHRIFTVPLADAANFDPSELKAWVAELLQGVAYIGIVEAAFYSNISLVPGVRSQTVSWHVHVVAWNAVEGDIRAIVDTVNRDYEPLLPGADTAKLKVMGIAGAASRVVYMLKGQLKEYRAWPRKQEVFDLKTGEITAVETGKWSQRKRDMRLGDLAKMFKVMAGRTIPGLCFAGGAGQAIWKAAEARARRRIAKENASTVEKLQPYRATLTGSPVTDADLRPASPSPVIR